jgi:hypothetical protein
MDPVTIFQVAASVVTFIDFTRFLISETSKAYRSPIGQSSTTVYLSTITEHIDEVQSVIQSTSKCLKDTSLTQSDHLIFKLCEQCEDIGAKMREMTRSLTAQGTTKFDFLKSSFATSVKAILKRDDISQITEQLDTIRGQISMALLISIW